MLLEVVDLNPSPTGLDKDRLIHLAALCLDTQRHTESSLNIGSEQTAFGRECDRTKIRQLAQENRAGILNGVTVGERDCSSGDTERRVLIGPLIRPREYASRKEKPWPVERDRLVFGGRHKIVQFSYDGVSGQLIKVLA